MPMLRPTLPEANGTATLHLGWQTNGRPTQGSTQHKGGRNNVIDDGVFNLCIAATLRMPLRLLADD
jgi:hypothetical protein